MTDDEASPPPAAGFSGAVAAIGERLIRVLPPAFLILVLLNCIFLGSLAWVIDHNAETRNALLTKIIEQCLVKR